MKRRTTFALLAASFAVLWVLLPAASQQPSVGRSDSPYHATDMSKPQESSGDSTTKGRLAVVPVDALCLEHIARFKRPKRYLFVEALPKNNYGKVLKTELRTRLSAPQ